MLPHLCTRCVIVIMQHCAYNMVLICWYCINVTLGYTRTTVGCTMQSSGLYIALVLGVFRSQTVICGGTELEQKAV